MSQTDDTDQDQDGTEPRGDAEPSGGYDVGYGRPPEHARFKKGQSGNPKGRPKGHRNAKTDLQEILDTQMTVRQGDKLKKITAQQAMFMSAVQKATKGDVRAFLALMALSGKYMPERFEERKESELSAEENAVIANLLKRGDLDAQ